MNEWLEVIMVRSAGGKAKTLAETLNGFMADVSRRGDSDDIHIFYRENLETDICILLSHSEKKTQTGGSPLGLRIVAAFKEVGQVHHTVWNEMER